MHPSPMVSHDLLFVALRGMISERNIPHISSPTSLGLTLTCALRVRRAVRAAEHRGGPRGPHGHRGGGLRLPAGRHPRPRRRAAGASRERLPSPAVGQGPRSSVEGASWSAEIPRDRDATHWGDGARHGPTQGPPRLLCGDPATHTGPGPARLPGANPLPGRPWPSRIPVCRHLNASTLACVREGGWGHGLSTHNVGSPLSSTFIRLGVGKRPSPLASKPRRIPPTGVSSRRAVSGTAPPRCCSSPPTAAGRTPPPCRPPPLRRRPSPYAQRIPAGLERATTSRGSCGSGPPATRG